MLQETVCLEIGKLSTLSSSVLFEQHLRSLNSKKKSLSLPKLNFTLSLHVRMAINSNRTIYYILA